MMQRITVGDKLVGRYDSDTNTFWKSVSGRKHLMRNLDAWGIQSEIVDKMQPKNPKIIITDSDDGTVYETDARAYHEYAFKRDFGFGAQHFLPREKFSKRESKVDELIKEKVVQYKD